MPSNSHVSDIVYRAVGLMSGWIEVIMLNSLNVRYDKVFLYIFALCYKFKCKDRWKNDISKYMWVYLNIINISAYCITRKNSVLANSLQIKNRVSVIN